MEITAQMVRDLRERTGEGLMSCKAALVAHGGDVEGAYEHLRCEGQLVVRRPGSKQPCGCPVR